MFFFHPRFSRLILHLTREQKLKSIYAMVNIRSFIQTDVERLSKGWYFFLCQPPPHSPNEKHQKWHLSRMINFISTFSLSLLVCLLVFMVFAAHIANVNSVIADCRRATFSRQPILDSILAH